VRQGIGKSKSKKLQARHRARLPSLFAAIDPSDGASSKWVSSTRSRSLLDVLNGAPHPPAVRAPPLRLPPQLTAYQTPRRLSSGARRVREH